MMIALVNVAPSGMTGNSFHPSPTAAVDSTGIRDSTGRHRPWLNLFFEGEGVGKLRKAAQLKQWGGTMGPLACAAVKSWDTLPPGFGSRYQGRAKRTSEVRTGETSLPTAPTPFPVRQLALPPRSVLISHIRLLPVAHLALLYLGPGPPVLCTSLSGPCCTTFSEGCVLELLCKDVPGPCQGSSRPSVAQSIK